MKSTKTIFLIALTAALLLGSLLPLVGQPETIITVGIQQWQADRFNERIFDQFEADHPGVKVVLVSLGDDAYISGAAYGIDTTEFFERSARFAQSADVLPISNYSFAVESVRAGHLLNLKPLIDGDSDFDQDDFFPVAWDSVAWDNGVWGVPISLSVEMLVYDANAFDEAAITYPDENWTLAELGEAARTLTQRDDEGNVEMPGFLNWNMLPFLISLHGQPLYNDTVVPAVPDFSSPELVTLLEQWRELEAEEVVSQFGNFDFERVPMRIEGLWRLNSAVMPSTDSDAVWQASLLPGGRSIVRFEGFGVSGLTDQPELAFELVEYMSKNAEVSAQFFGDSPARQSLVGVEVENNNFIRPQNDPEVQALIDEGLQKGISYSDTLFGEYILQGLAVGVDENGLPLGGTDVAKTLGLAQEKAEETLVLAEEQRQNNTVLAVATPVPTPVLGENEIVLSFRLGLPFSPIPNREQWDRVITEFAAQDPLVGNINLITGFSQEAQEQEVDCFYDPFANVQTMELSGVINLDPFTNADPNFDDADFLAGVLENVQKDGRTWAYPIAIQPALLQYNTMPFESAGVPFPENGWTIDEFVYALQTLKDAGLEGVNAPFVPSEGTNGYLFMLMAAYGFTPVDHSTNPPTIHLLDNIDGIRQVLNMAKDGLIDYRELDTMGGGSGGSSSIPVTSTSFTNLIFNLSFQLENPDTEFSEPTRYTSYPTGSQFTPVSFSTGNAFINSTSLNPDACYRWITTIAQRPELLLGMPVRASLVNDPALAESVTPDVASLFSQISEQLSASNVLVIPDTLTGYTSFTGYVEQIWINQAFDNYVLEDGDLEQDLQDAERKIAEMRTCAAQYPELTAGELMEMTQEQISEYYNNTRECIIAVDPDLAPRFTPMESN